MYIDDGSSPMIIDTTFRNNSGAVSAGAIWMSGASATIRGCKFIGNSAYNAGAITVFESNPVVFTGDSPAKGYWKGINLESNNVLNEIRYCTVEYVGSSGHTGAPDSVAGLYIRSGARLSISDTTVRSSLGYGISIANGASVDDCSGLSYEDIDWDDMAGTCGG